MGGKSSDKGSKQMIAMQKKEAEEARQKEAARQGRLDQGLMGIRHAFHGTPVMQTSTSSVALPSGGGAALPAGYSYATLPGTTRTVQDYRGGKDAVQPAPRQVYTPGKTIIKGPDGKTYEPGQVISTTAQTDTGQRTGGINDEFYNKYKQSILDYYTPQVAEQYADAQKELTYRLARAGTLKSSAATENTADLAKQEKLNTGKVKTQADTAAGALKTRVAQEEQNAINQLYATENPDVAANTALASIRDITAETPDLTPLGEIFKIATIGSANALKGYMGEKYGQKYVPGYNDKGATRTIT
jgi:hypothetical protein